VGEAFCAVAEDKKRIENRIIVTADKANEYEFLLVFMYPLLLFFPWKILIDI
jgi:hypothetical protein